MKCFFATLCVASLLFNSVAFAGGQGVSTRLGKRLLSKAKTFGVGMLAAGVLSCGMFACTQGEVSNSLREEHRRVAGLERDRNATLSQLIIDLEDIEGAQIGVVKSIDPASGTLVLESKEGKVYLQLQEGEVLINNSESPLEVILSEEAYDEGLIAAGSWWAKIPALAVAGGLVVLGGIGTTLAVIESDNWKESAMIIGLTLLVPPIMGLGTYHLLLLL